MGREILLGVGVAAFFGFLPYAVKDMPSYVAWLGMVGGAAICGLALAPMEPKFVWPLSAAIAGFLIVFASVALLYERSQEAAATAPLPSENTHQQPSQSEVKATEKLERVFVRENITPEYLINIFREHTDIQGVNLTAAYLGKWMKVSGSLGNVISTTPALAQLTFERPEVPRTERTWFYYTDFFMIFRKPWIDRLTILKRGDKLTVIGQIERIDGVSVQLENCELVDERQKPWANALTAAIG